MLSFYIITFLPFVLAAPFSSDSGSNPELGDLFLGDIKLAPDFPDTDVTPLGSVVDRRRLWPDNTVYYIIDEPTYTDEQVAAIEEAIQELIDYVRVDGELCVNIVPRTDESSYVRVFDDGACYSYIGRIVIPQDMSLAPGCIDRNGTIMHEFLHALGIYHEQNRGDRDDYIYVNFNNIQPGTEGNFVKLTEGEEIDHLGTEYDYTSVMHYPSHAFSINENIPTIITKDPEYQDVIGQRVRMSDADIERIQILYDCVSPENTEHFKHLAGKNIFKGD